jgi:hypothetical protein
VIAQRVRLARLRFARCNRPLKRGRARHGYPKWRNAYGAGNHETYCDACGTTPQMRAKAPSRRRNH